MPQPANTLIAETVAKKKAIKTVAYNVMTDNAGIVSQGASFKKGLDAAGVKDLGQVGTLGKQTDFTSAAGRLMQKNPDAIVVAATQAEAVGMIATLHDKGYKGQIIAGETILGTGVFKSQPDALENAPFPVYFLASEATGLGKTFVDDYQKKYQAAPDDFAAQGFNAIYTMAMGLKAAGKNPTRESLTKALNALSSLDNTIYGKVTFSGGQLDASSSVKIVHYTKPDGTVAVWNAS
jgi:branched-chain amino acid transport system substrate-binding protein